ncbi:MAG: hypothetical protein SFU98_16390 [Leptospiraceae bacterium]|nr:hypothetical protein [Leptospiraceae bacterium]
MTLNDQREILKNYSEHELMKHTSAIVKDGKQVIFAVKYDGVIFTYSTKSSFIKFIKDYDKKKGKQK